MMAAMMATILCAHATTMSNFIADAFMALMHPTRDYTCKYSQLLTSGTAG